MPTMGYPWQFYLFIHKIVVLLIFTVVIATLIIALADYAYQKYSH